MVRFLGTFSTLMECDRLSFIFFFGEMGGILLRVDMEIVAIFFTFQLLRKATKNVITCVLLT